MVTSFHTRGMQLQVHWPHPPATPTSPTHLWVGHDDPQPSHQCRDRTDGTRLGEELVVQHLQHLQNTLDIATWERRRGEVEG